MALVGAGKPRAKDGRPGTATGSDFVASSGPAVRGRCVRLTSVVLHRWISRRPDKDYLPRPRPGIRMAPKIRRRSRLRRKETTDFLGRLEDEFGMEVPLNDAPLDEAEAGPHRLLLRGNDAIAILLESGIAPTIRGLLAFPAKKRAVT